MHTIFDHVRTGASEGESNRGMSDVLLHLDCPETREPKTNGIAIMNATMGHTASSP